MAGLERGHGAGAERRLRETALTDYGDLRSPAPAGRYIASSW
jgi:hypothetical protein